MNSFYTQQELKELGFRHLGQNVLISRYCSIYGAANISIGDHVRIDDFCILSGNITLGNYIHISAYTALFAGKSGIQMGDFSGASSRCVIYAESDDYSGEAMTNPMVPDEFRNVQGGKVTFGRHVLLGSGCTVLPGVTIGEGTSVGSMSLINKSLDPWGIYLGIPCRRLKDRSKKLLEMEDTFLKKTT